MMSPLFGKSTDRLTQDEAAEAEFQHLSELSAAELAEELMPAFGDDGPRGGKEINALQASNWLMRSYPRGHKFVRKLHRPVCEALELLEHVGLVEVLGGRRGSISTGAHLRATRLGLVVLADETVDRYLTERAGM
jgi:hypothetical protein